MKNSGIFYILCSAVGVVAIVVSLFLTFWTGINLSDLTIGLFDEYPGDNGIFATLIMILTLAVLAVLVLALLIEIFKFAKIGKGNYLKLNKVLGLVAGIITLVILILGIIFILAEREEVLGIVAGIKFGIGFYIALAGMVIATTSTYLSANGIKSRKK